MVINITRYQETLDINMKILKSAGCGLLFKTELICNSPASADDTLFLS
jgi:hypothetical protein